MVDEIIIILINYLKDPNLMWIKLFYADHETGNIDSPTYRHIPIDFTITNLADDVKLIYIPVQPWMN